MRGSHSSSLKVASLQVLSLAGEALGRPPAAEVASQAAAIKLTLPHSRPLHPDGGDVRVLRGLDSSVASFVFNRFRQTPSLLRGIQAREFCRYSDAAAETKEEEEDVESSPKILTFSDLLERENGLSGLNNTYNNE